MNANWSASLEPETVGDNRLRSGRNGRPAADHIDSISRVGGNDLRKTCYEQCKSESGNPLRHGLEGYCPVELQEHDRWAAGNPDISMAYQGQLFYFSSDAARKRFEASPEKYAPAQSGNDIVLAVEENRTVPGKANHSAVWHERLYLFSSSATLAMFQEDPTRYAKGPHETPLQIPENSL